jgi:hypothetical protein
MSLDSQTRKGIESDVAHFDLDVLTKAAITHVIEYLIV